MKTLFSENSKFTMRDKSLDELSRYRETSLFETIDFNNSRGFPFFLNLFFFFLSLVHYNSLFFLIDLIDKRNVTFRAAMLIAYF